MCHMLDQAEERLRFHSGFPGTVGNVELYSRGSRRSTQLRPPTFIPSCRSRSSARWGGTPSEDALRVRFPECDQPEV